MKILIGYYQRSGSTLLQHMLNGHSEIRSFSDVNSFLVLPALLCGYAPKGNVCVKPMDNFFLFRSAFLYRHFDKFIWLARDPRDSYISALEAGFAYGSSLYLPGKKVHGIDVGLLQRWKRIYRQYFQRKDRWHLIRYEDLVQDPDAVLHDLFTYLELTYEKVFPFKKFNLAAGGDPKLMKTSTIHQKSVQRYQGRLNGEQLGIFKEWLGDEMFALGYG